MRHPQALPTASLYTDDQVAIIRQLGRLLGPWYGAADDTRNAADIIGLGYMIATVRETTSDSLAEAFVGEATNLLAEWEAIYRIPSPSPDIATRRTALLARTRAGSIAHPVTMQRVILGLAGASAAIIETIYTGCTADPDQVHRIVVAVDASVYGSSPDYTPQLDQVDDVVQRMKPAHVIVTYTGTQTADFLTDDANSLTDNTVLRA